jgi:hypothetical protein
MQPTNETACQILIMNAAEPIFRSDTNLLREGKVFSVKVSTDSTSDFQSILSPGRHRAESFFTTHQMRSGGFRPVAVNKYQPDWVLGVLLLGFIILAWVQVFYRHRLQQILMAPYSRRFLNQLVRDGNLLSERISLALGFLYFLTTSLFIYQCYELIIVKKSGVFPEGFTVFVIIAIVVVGLWIVKTGLMRFLAYIFRTRQTTSEYILNIFIFNIITAVLLLPLLVFVVYLKSPVFLWACIAIFILFFIFRIIRGFLIGISITKFPYLFLFVYLCTLEFLPLVMLTKLVFSYYF